MGKLNARHKLLVLDAMRGVAACAVVLYHRAFRMPFPRGYLAVDFFFMLSGFVITLAYQSRLDQGWTVKDFLATRLARLYPLYLLGLVIGLGVGLTDPATSFGVQWCERTVMNLFLLPAWTGAHVGAFDSFPYNIPAWSLFFEILANLIHALFLRRLSDRLLAALVLAVGVCLIYVAGVQPLNFGEHNADFLGGLLRVLFSYGMGMVLCRIWTKTSWHPAVWSPVLAAMLLLLLAGVGSARIGPYFDLVTVMGIFPILLFLGASAHLPVTISGLARELGAVSYGVYILHQPVLHFLLLHGWSSPQGGGQALHMLASAAFLIGIFTFASIIDRLYDTPARDLLRRTFMIAPPPARKIRPGEALHSTRSH